MFAALPRRLPGLRLAVPVQELRLRTDVFTGGLEALPVAWRPDRGDRRVAGATVARVARAILVAGLVGTVYGVLVTEPSAGWRGVPELGYGVDLRFQAACSYSLISPPSTGRRLIRPWSRSGVG